MAIEVGKTVAGKITGLANFGAFIDIGDNKTGLVHISEVSDKFIKNINDELAVGQDVKVKVLSIADDGKIALSIRKAEGNEEAGSDKSAQAAAAPRPRRQQQKPRNSQSFDALMNSFLKESEDRLSSLRRNTESKRGGRGGRRG